MEPIRSATGSVSGLHSRAEPDRGGGSGTNGAESRRHRLVTIEDLGVPEGNELEPLSNHMIDGIASSRGARSRAVSASRRIAAACLCLALAMSMLFSAAGPSAAGEERVITAFEQSPTEDGLQARFTLNGETKVRLLHLRNPDRIAVDFDSVVPAVAIAPAQDNPMVATIRHGLVAKDRYRVIFRLKSPGSAHLEQSMTGAGEVVTLSIGPDDRKVAASRGPVAATNSAGGATASSADQSPAPVPSKTRQLVIVVDPGHGGEDNGAVSPSGTFEKDINLAMARAIRAALLEFPGVKVVLTRDDDTFIPLDERSAIGRKAHADLFISVHADSIRYNDLRGATVYTLSDRASDELSRQIAASENAADRFAGPEWQQSEPDVFDILLDLTRRETVSFSEHFATSLVADLSRDKIDLIKNPKRSASFVVLKAPDVPSVLVECGFLSNPDDETLLKDDAWRKKMADAIADAVVAFFRGKDAVRSVDAG